MSRIFIISFFELVYLGSSFLSVAYITVKNLKLFDEKIKLKNKTENTQKTGSGKCSN